MKRIINGKRYDTVKAEVVAEWFDRRVRLYRMPSGAWFVVEETDVMSEFTTTVTARTHLRPMGNAAVLELLIAHGCVDTLERFFSDGVKDA